MLLEVRNLGLKHGASLARAVAEHFDLPLLVAWLHDPSRPEVAHHVLGLLRVGAWLLPDTALQQVMPLFASVGQSALWRDSDASLEIGRAHV